MSQSAMTSTWVELQTRRHTPAHSSTQTFEHDMLQDHLRTRRLLDGGHVRCFTKITPPPHTHKIYMHHWSGKWCWFQLWCGCSMAWSHTDISMETREMLHLFNRCHISFKRLETDIQEGFFFPFLRLQINVACVLSLFYKNKYCKRNM